MRTVHFFDAFEAGWCAGMALRPAASDRSRGAADLIVLVGGREDASYARSMGVSWDARLPAPVGRPWLAWRQARSMLRTMPDVGRICAWSPSTARLARLATPGASVVVEVASGSRRDTAPDAGLSRDRASMLARWRLDPSSAIIGFLADGSRCVAGIDASFLLGVLVLAGTPAVGVVWRGSARSVERGERMMRSQHRRWRLIIEDEPLPRWIGACDAGVGLASSGGISESARWARASGVRVVQELPADASITDEARVDGVRRVRGGVRHACAGATLDVLEHLARCA